MSLRRGFNHCLVTMVLPINGEDENCLVPAKILLFARLSKNVEKDISPLSLREAWVVMTTMTIMTRNMTTAMTMMATTAMVTTAMATTATAMTAANGSDVHECDGDGDGDNDDDKCK